MASPVANQYDPDQLIPLPIPEENPPNIELYQFIPSLEYKIELLEDVPFPTATHKEPFHATPYPILLENPPLVI